MSSYFDNRLDRVRVSTPNFDVPEGIGKPWVQAGRDAFPRSEVSGIFHYTDKRGWNGIRSQPVWKFKAGKPRDPKRPRGAYFTDIEPTPTNLRTLCKRIRIPKSKQEYVFWFEGSEGLSQLKGGQGRDARIFFRATDYYVVEERQRHGNLTTDIVSSFT